MKKIKRELFFVEKDWQCFPGCFEISRISNCDEDGFGGKVHRISCGLDQEDPKWELDTSTDRVWRLVMNKREYDYYENVHELIVAFKGHAYQDKLVELL